MIISAEEEAVYNDIAHLGKSVWELSLEATGLSTDPRMLSVMLFKRLWSNHRGFTLLWKHHLMLEAEIVLRSGIEAAICIAANSSLGDSFVTLMAQDAAHTVQSQLKRLRADGDPDQVTADGEVTLREMLGALPEGKKPAPLRWADLADHGKVPQLYLWYRMLSGLSSHVTGVSVMRDAVGAGEGEDQSALQLHDEIDAMSRRMYLMMMAGTTLLGSLIHTRMLDAPEQTDAAYVLLDRLNVVTDKWWEHPTFSLT